MQAQDLPYEEIAQKAKVLELVNVTRQSNQGFRVRRNAIGVFGNFRRDVVPHSWRNNRVDLGVVMNGQRQYVDEPQIGISKFIRQIALDHSFELPEILQRKIKELSELPMNWDEDGAKAISSFSLMVIVDTLKHLYANIAGFLPPYLVPTFNGSIQIEWHNDFRYLEIELVDNGWSVVGALDAPGHDPEFFSEDFDRHDLNDLEAAYRWFAESQIIWPFQ